MQLSNPAQERARAALATERAAQADMAKLALLVERFHRSFEAQQRFDADVIASLVRSLRNPSSARPCGRI